MHKLGLCGLFGAAACCAVLSSSALAIAEPVGPGIGTSPDGERRQVQTNTGEGASCAISSATGTPGSLGPVAFLAAVASIFARRRLRTETRVRR
jgi:hypothetical protein